MGGPIRNKHERGETEYRSLEKKYDKTVLVYYNREQLHNTM